VRVSPVLQKRYGLTVDRIIDVALAWPSAIRTKIVRPGWLPRLVAVGVLPLQPVTAADDDGSSTQDT